jgi:hypothetical protein
MSGTREALVDRGYLSVGNADIFRRRADEEVKVAHEMTKLE